MVSWSEYAAINAAIVPNNPSRCGRSSATAFLAGCRLRPCRRRGRARCRVRARRSGSSRSPSARPPVPISIPPRSPAQPTDCDERLAEIAVIAPMPRLIGPGACGGRDMVQLDAVLLADGTRIAIKPAPVLRCEMAESFAAWLRDEAAPRVPATRRPCCAVSRTTMTSNAAAATACSAPSSANTAKATPSTCARSRSPTAARIGLTDVTVDKELREGLRESACQRFTHRARARSRRLSRRPYPSRYRRSAAMATASASGTCASRRRRLPSVADRRQAGAAAAAAAGRRRVKHSGKLQRAVPFWHHSSGVSSAHDHRASSTFVRCARPPG